MRLPRQNLAEVSTLVWHFAYRHRGKRYRFSLDRYVGRHVRTKTEAREIADALRTDVRRGTLTNLL